MFFKSEEEAEKYSKEITQDFNSIIKGFLNKNGDGIMVQASTLGSLEAILTFLNKEKVEIAAVGLGNLQKKDVLKIQTIHARNEVSKKEHLTILAFDIKILPEAQTFADDNGIKIFTADIIYHLFDEFVKYKDECIKRIEERKRKRCNIPLHVENSRCY